MKVGALVVKREEELSDAMKELIDDEVRTILNQSMDRVSRVLKTQMPALHRLADALLEKETLSSEEIAAIVKG